MQTILFLLVHVVFTSIIW